MTSALQQTKQVYFYLPLRMASTETDIPSEMQDRGKWYGDAADYWKVRKIELLVGFLYI